MAYPYTPQYFNPTPGGQYGQVSPYQPPMQQMQANQPRIICQQVASVEEAKAIPTDYSGVTQVFLDFAHDQVYIKSANYQTGGSYFKVYANIPEVTPAPPPDYVPRQEFDALCSVVNGLKQQIGGMTIEQQDTANVPRRGTKSNANDAK